MAGPSPLLRAGRYVAVAWNFVGTILAGAVVGFLVDRWLGWAPVGVMAGTILGAAGGFVQLIHVLRRLDRVGDRPEP